jgi:hypothetical protein
MNTPRALLGFSVCICSLVLVCGTSLDAVAQNAPGNLEQDVGDLVLFDAPEGVTEVEFAALVSAANKLDPKSKQVLLAAGSDAFPALINALLSFDYSTKRGSRSGRSCYDFILRLLNKVEQPKWKISDDPSQNKTLIETWYQRCELCYGHEEEWWKLLGVEPGPWLETFLSIGLPSDLILDLSSFNEMLIAARARFEIARSSSEEELVQIRKEMEASLMTELADSLPSEWPNQAAISPALIAEQLRGGEVEIPWPIGLYESFSETLRSTERDAEKNQRTIRVEGHPEDIEVSVKSFGESQYAVVPLVRTWVEARDICEENGGHLACIGSQEEMDVVLSLMPAVGYKGATRLELSEVDRLFFVGASDGHKEGNWQWLDGRAVSPEFWLHPSEGVGGKYQSMDIAQPSNNDGIEHCAAITQYVGDPALDEKIEPRWGLMDWYNGFPGRFICEWGPEPVLGPWGGETLVQLEPYLRTYFRGKALLEDELQSARVDEEKNLRPTRKKALTAIRSCSKEMLEALQTQLGGRNASLTSRQLAAVQVLYWFLSDEGNTDCLAGVGLTQDASGDYLFNRRYKVFTAPQTHSEAERLCELLGGRLATFHSSPFATDLMVGRECPAADVLKSDIECRFFLELLREAGVSSAWLGYRKSQGYKAPMHPHRTKWIDVADSTHLGSKWVLEELLPPSSRLGSSWTNHTTASVLTDVSLEDGVATFHAKPGQVQFPLPFESVPPYAVKARIEDQIDLSKWASEGNGLGFSLIEVNGRMQANWKGDPFVGGEKVSFYVSPLTLGPISMRLPYICVWDS